MVKDKIKYLQTIIDLAVHHCYNYSIQMVKGERLRMFVFYEDDIYKFVESLPNTFQARVAPWMRECFGETISKDKLERGDRLLEEVLELLQSGNYPAERVAKLVDYVYNRPIGEPEQEVGGVMVTLAAYCLAHGLDMHEAGEIELKRIWGKIEQIRLKQAIKNKALGSPLP